MPAKQSALVRLRWALWAGALVIGIGAGAAISLLHKSSHQASSSGTTSPVETWAAGVRKAPAFALTDQDGKPVTLAALHGRPVIVTFIDPLCRDYCPREASVITEAVNAFAASRPAIVAVSVNPWANTAQNFREDALHWRLTPQWRWGIGTHAQLAAVWRDYQVGVQVTTKVVAGITVREITHSGAAYLVDGSGYERALFLYPFSAADVAGALRELLS